MNMIFHLRHSMINDGRSLPKRFRPVQSSTGKLFYEQRNSTQF